MRKSKKYLIIAVIVIVLLMSATNVNAALINLLKKLEENNEVKLTAYDDGGGVWTIGYGSIYNYDLGRAVREGDTITIDQANRYLQREADEKINAVKLLVKVPITNNQLIALSSFAYNEGIGALANSTLLRKLNSGVDKNEVAQEFDKWIYQKGKIVQGLINRRNAEKTLFLT
jgi:lysozyme